MATDNGAAPKLVAAFDKALRTLESSLPLYTGSTDDLLLLLDRWGRVKAQLASGEFALGEELNSRGVPWTDIDRALGNKPGTANARHNAKGRRASKPELPGRAPSEVSEDLGLKSAKVIYDRIKRVGAADWWGAFTHDQAGRVVQLPYERREQGEIRILSIEGYEAAKGRPGRKPKVAAEEVAQED